ncbi:MAG: HEAT repeat domain-containing protein [Bryobacteraceae bacterium]
MMDPSLSVAQRNNACVELRGSADPEVVATMRKALDDRAVRVCAGTNLRKAGAIPELKDALADPNFEIRALAARELGGFEKPELLPLLAAAGRDPQLLVGMNAVEGLADYRDPAVLPYLLDLAKNGGLVGTAALDRALTFRDPRVLETARVLLGSKDVSDKLAAMRVIGAMGDQTDIPKLRQIQEKETGMVSAAGRGFGLIPAISLSRAAETTIEKIGAGR